MNPKPRCNHTTMDTRNERLHRSEIGCFRSVKVAENNDQWYKSWVLLLSANIHRATKSHHLHHEGYRRLIKLFFSFLISIFSQSVLSMFLSQSDSPASDPRIRARGRRHWETHQAASWFSRGTGMAEIAHLVRPKAVSFSSHPSVDVLRQPANMLAGE